MIICIANRWKSIETFLNILKYMLNYQGFLGDFKRTSDFSDLYVNWKAHLILIE
jgi:hypothetical protein